MRKPLSLSIFLFATLSLAACGNNVNASNETTASTDSSSIVVEETDAQKLAKRVEGTIASLKEGNFTVSEVNAENVFKTDGRGHICEKTMTDEKYYFMEGSSWYVVTKNDSGNWERNIVDSHPSFNLLDNASVIVFNDSRAKIKNGSKEYYAYYDASNLVVTSVSDITDVYEFYDIGKTTVNIPQYVIPKTKEEKIAEFETILNKIKTPNFTVSEGKDVQTHLYLVSANGIKADNDYYTVEGGKGYRYYFDEEKNTWYREEGSLAKNFNYTNVSVNDLLDESDNIFSVNIDGTSFNAYIKDVSNALVLYSEQVFLTFRNIGSTFVEIPTNWQEKTPAESNLIVENGVYNVKLMKQVLADWISGNNQFNGDIIDLETGYGLLQEISLLNPQNLEMYVLTVNEKRDTKYFVKFALGNEALLQDMVDQKITTKEDFEERLNALPARKILVQSIIGIDKTISSNEASARVENLLTKVGSDANVIFAYETEPGGSTLTYGIGYGYYSVAYTSDSKLHLFGVDCLSKEYVLNDTDKYGVTSDKVTDIYEQNIAFFQTVQYNEFDNAFYLGNESNPYSCLVKVKSKDITSITINENCETIDEYAFHNCKLLASIKIPNSVTSIGIYAFANCKALASITLGNNVALIEKRTFNSCISLQSVSVPNSVASIGEGAFYNCTSLKSATLGNSVTSIDSQAFGNCTSLISIIIPDCLSSIGSRAFYNCTSLQHTEYNNALYIGNSQNPYLVLMKAKSEKISSCGINNKCKFIYDSAFYDCTLLTSVTIPNSVISIGQSSFRNCASLSSITIPNSVITIGGSAFYICRALTSITIPNSVTSLGASAFHGCSSLVSATIGNGVTSLGQYVFDDCTSLKTVTIGNGIKLIQNYAFSDCTLLTTMRFAGTVEQWNGIEKEKMWNHTVPATKVICTNGEVTL